MEIAQGVCDADPDCSGVYDKNCDNKPPFTLCSITKPFGRTFKSCLYEKCKKWTTNGDVAVCDEYVEIRQTSIEELNEMRDDLGPLACDPDDDDYSCDDDDFERK